MAKVELPELEHLKFNGNRKNWQPFWEQCETAIHKNSDLAPSEKLNYLRAALIGDGAAAIAGLQPTSESKVKALNTKCDKLLLQFTRAHEDNIAK